MKTAGVPLRPKAEGERSARSRLTDEHLLTRFVMARDQLAFAQLVRTHGPMVLGVCRRVLKHAQQAEEAFQATFLILACEGCSVFAEDTVGSWLYRVAYRTAQDVRAMRARRQEHAVPAAAMAQTEAQAVEPQDLRDVLEQELNRLPAKCQSALVLAALHRLSRRDAAEQLGISEGTLSSRLAHGRKLLTARLARHGITLEASALADVLADRVCAANIPLSLISGTILAAAMAANGNLAAVATPVADLVKTRHP